MRRTSWSPNRKPWRDVFAVLPFTRASRKEQVVRICFHLRSPVSRDCNTSCFLVKIERRGKESGRDAMFVDGESYAAV